MKVFYLEINYVDELWPQIDIKTSSDYTKFKQNEVVKSIFKEFILVSKKFYVRYMMVWVMVKGLPLCAWTSKTFKRVVS